MADRYSTIMFSDGAAGGLRKLRVERNQHWLQADLTIESSLGTDVGFKLEKNEAIELAEWLLEEFTGGE